MRTLKFILIVLCAVALTAGNWLPGGHHRDLGTEVLGANDGWAALEEGTTGAWQPLPH